MKGLHACAKLILFGEHAVVYGRPALALGLPDGLVLRSMRPRESTLSLRVPAWGLDADLRSEGAMGKALRRLFRRVPGPRRGCDLLLDSRIPVASGLGSSAALSVLVVRALARARGIEIGPEQVRDLAHEAEQVFHGWPSGLDDATATYGGLCLFRRDGWEDPQLDRPGFPCHDQQTLHVPYQVPRLVIGDTGVRRATSTVVEELRGQRREHLERVEALFDGMEACLWEGLDALVAGDEARLGLALRHNQEILRQLDLSCPEIDRMVDMADDLGAAGCKLTGAGRGGCVLALARGREDELVRRWSDAGFKAWEVEVPAPWVRPAKSDGPQEARTASETESGTGTGASAREPAAPRRSSRLRGWSGLQPLERRRDLAHWLGTPHAKLAASLGEQGLSLAAADLLVENVVGLYALPFCVAPNFLINGRETLVPMVVEEASVVAAAANGARIARAGGGFSAQLDPCLMICQIQLFVEDPEGALDLILAHKQELLAAARQAAPGLVGRGGGPVDLELRLLGGAARDQGFLMVHLLVDVRDAMGANLVNTMGEAMAPGLESLTRGRRGLCILSNLADRRLVYVELELPLSALGVRGFSPKQVRDGIVAASELASLDPYRAATHNKGIMNGIDAVLLATGNDWRAVEAGAHAFAARDGHYGPLCVWERGEDRGLHGRLSLPMAVGVVGGATRVHPGARVALQILGASSAADLAAAAAATGMANNLAALRALATEGIQEGHMRLHARRDELLRGP